MTSFLVDKLSLCAQNCKLSYPILTTSEKNGSTQDFATLASFSVLALMSFQCV